MQMIFQKQRKEKTGLNRFKKNNLKYDVML